MAARRCADRPAHVLVHAAGEEALQPVATAVEDAERRVARAGELDGGVEEPVEYGLQVEVARERAAVAGGIGLAPLRPVIRALGERARVLDGARGPGELLYGDELRDWDARVIVDVPEPGWTGPVGVVTKLIEREPFDPDGAAAPICGPEVMTRFAAAAAALRARGVAPDAIWVSLERSMHCGAGHCGHCQLGPHLICRDGPVFRHDRVEPLLRVAEL